MIKGVLLDVGGVVAIGSDPIAGAAQAIANLRAHGVAFRFVTNISRQAHKSVVASLNRMGFSVQPSEVFTPAVAASAWLKAHGRAPHLLVHPALKEDFAGLEQGAPDALVVGDAGQDFTYEALNAAFRLLMGDTPFLALAQNRYFRDSDGALSLDAGAFVAALEYASGKTAIAMGKPAAAFFQTAVASMACQPHEAVMVGDDAEFDVAPAIAAGLAGILVQTGKYAPGAETAHNPRPTHVAADIGEAVDWIIAQKG